MRKIASFLFLALTFASCSSEDDDAPETATSFCQSWARVACSDDVVSACQAADVRDCRASQMSFCLDLVPAAGFSGDSADECLDSVEAAYADADLSAAELTTVLRLGPPCDRLARGTRGEGEACTSARDCDGPDGFDCVFKGGSPEGTCERPELVGAGQDCSAVNAVCEEGFYCNGDNCIAGERPGDPCQSHAQCGSTGFCGPTSVCEARRDVSESCGFDEQCESGLCYEFSATDRVCTDRIRLSRSESLCEELR